MAYRCRAAGAFAAAIALLAGSGSLAPASPFEPGHNIERVTYRGSIATAGRPSIRVRIGLNNRGKVKYLFGIRTDPVTIPCVEGPDAHMRLSTPSLPLRLNGGGAFSGGASVRKGQISFWGKADERRVRGGLRLETNDGCTAKLSWRATP